MIVSFPAQAAPSGARPSLLSINSSGAAVGGAKGWRTRERLALRSRNKAQDARTVQRLPAATLGWGFREGRKGHLPPTASVTHEHRIHVIIIVRTFIAKTKAAHWLGQPLASHTEGGSDQQEARAATGWATPALPALWAARQQTWSERVVTGSRGVLGEHGQGQ